jgi:predicted RNA-binding Zn-ribbon protein involved in translation (DUF1610 family)
VPLWHVILLHVNRRVLIVRLVLLAVGVGALAWIIAAHLGSPWVALIFLILLAAVVLLVLFTGAVQNVVERLFWPRGVLAPDQRGRKVELRERRKMPTPFRFDRKRQRRWFKAHPPPWWGWLLICGLGAVGWVALRIPSQYSALGYAVIPLFMLSSRWLKVAGLRMRAPFYISLGRCASCGYDLSHHHPESDGCTVCPECGAAWRLRHCPGCGREFDDVLPDACPDCGWRRGTAASP